MSDRPILVTGASGFLGRLLVRRLLDEGRAVRVLERRPSDAFDGLALDRTPGDVTDDASVAAAVKGVGTVFHLAGVVSHLERDRERLTAVNVGGVERMLRAAREAGCGRVVHVSSTASVGMASGPGELMNEESAYPEAARRYPYSLTKRLGEEAAMRAAAEGQDVVVVCPAFVIGAGDVNRISTFATEQYLRGTLRFITPGGLSYVDARDVVECLLLAEAKGQAGRRYIATSADGNLAHRDYFALVGELAGRRRLTAPLPGPLAVPSARLLAALRIPLPVKPDELASSCHWWYASAARARDELGLQTRSVREAVEATIAWYRDRGLRAR